MNIKMIVTDLDNTLLRRDKTISNYTRDILARCQECGILFAHATTDYSGHYKRMFPDGVPENIKIFYFRGGINYNKLSFVHRTMMSMLVKAVQKKSVLSEEEKLFLSSYGSEIDFCDKKTIEPLIEFINDTL